MSDVVIEPATAEDLDDLSTLLGGLFSEEKDFRPDKAKQLRGLRLIFEQPNRGRVFVLRRDRAIVAMINLLFTISTAEGGFVLLLEDLVVHDSYRDQGYGSMLLEYAIEFREEEKLSAHHVADRSTGNSLAEFLPSPWLRRVPHAADAVAHFAGDFFGRSFVVAAAVSSGRQIRETDTVCRQ